MKTTAPQAVALNSNTMAKPTTRPPHFLQQKAETSVRRVSSEILFANESELLIDHSGLEYRLRITRQNKLILTK